MEYKKLISNRKSVRDYKKTALKNEHIQEIKEYVNKAKKLIKDCGLFVSDFEKETKVKSSVRVKYK